MRIGTERGYNSGIWKVIVGDDDDFSLENRAFNFVCVISFALLLMCLIFNAVIAIYSMTFLLTAMLLMLGGVYYLSRFKKKYKISVIGYAVSSYVGLIANYFYNGGINGPTLILFFVAFCFLMVLATANQHFFWKVLHVAIVVTLISIEYFYPDTVPQTYQSRKDRFLDIGFSTVISITFIFTITTYVRRYYEERRRVANERATAIELQNKQIIAQNQQLEKVNEEKNKIFSIVSHDLKGPLDSIRGYLVLLSGNMLEESEKATIGDELLEQTKYTTDLLMNLMSWAKAQMHGVSVNLGPTNLNVLIDDVVGHIKSVAARKNIKLTYSIDRTLELICDKDMLHIVIRNLVNNAIKFTESGGEVKIKVSNHENTAVISISDTGIGIPPEKQSEIFTLKTRSTYGTKKEKGIGLGLMMCKEFMDYQQGKIWFESKQGVGTTFYISLPLTRLK